MIKRLYLANGTLQTPLPKWSEDISVDAGLADYMDTTLNVGDWAYLAITWYGQSEIVKVYKSYSGLQVDRSQDGTRAAAFPAGAEVKYQLTQAEIQDAVTALEISAVYLYASGYGVMEVTESNGAWGIAYTEMHPTTVGGIRAYYESVNGVLYLVDYFPAAGCCVEGGTGAPLIGGPYFYFTSQLYALESSDAMQPGPNPKYPNESSFGFGDIWLLDQPNVIETMDVTTTTGVNFANLFGSQGSFSAIDEYIEPKGAWINYANTFGTQGSFSVEDTSYMANNCYILQALLYGNEVAYNNGVDQYMATSAAIISATLS